MEIKTRKYGPVEVNTITIRHATSFYSVVYRSHAQNFAMLAGLALHARQIACETPDRKGDPYHAAMGQLFSDIYLGVFR